jgi:hypothetical protein
MENGELWLKGAKGLLPEAVTLRRFWQPELGCSCQRRGCARGTRRARCRH